MTLPRVFAVCLWLCACKSDSVADVVAKSRPGVEKTFVALHALEAQVQAAPELTAAKVEAPAVPLLLEKPRSDEDNAMFIYADDLAKPGEAKAVELRTLDSLPLVQCGSLLGAGTLFSSTAKVSPSVAKGYLAACERVRFALVIRGREFRAPEVGADAKFVSGLYRAEVLVFDLSTGKALGGFPVTAKNAGDVTAVAGEDLGQRLLRNLEAAIYTALRDGARQSFPGSLPPPTQ